MIFDDLVALNEIIQNGRTDSKFREDHDPEVERLYSSSPPIIEQCLTYDLQHTVPRKDRNDFEVWLVVNVLDS
jgi:hypothetical protein